MVVDLYCRGGGLVGWTNHSVSSLGLTSTCIVGGGLD